MDGGSRYSDGAPGGEGGGRVTPSKAIEILRGMYVFNPANLDDTTLKNKAIDLAIEALRRMEQDGKRLSD